MNLVMMLRTTIMVDVVQHEGIPQLTHMVAFRRIIAAPLDADKANALAGPDSRCTNHAIRSDNTAHLHIATGGWIFIKSGLRRNPQGQAI